MRLGDDQANLEIAKHYRQVEKKTGESHSTSKEGSQIKLGHWGRAGGSTYVAPPGEKNARSSPRQEYSEDFSGTINQKLMRRQNAQHALGFSAARAPFERNATGACTRVVDAIIKIAACKLTGSSFLRWFLNSKPQPLLFG